MRTLTLVAAVWLLTPAAALAQGSSSRGTGQQIAALQRQVLAQAREIRALSTQVASIQGTLARSNVSGLAAQVSTIQSTLQQAVATETCHYANLATLDYGFFDVIALIAGEPEQFSGQVVSDNGACATVGLTPPSPASEVDTPQALSPRAWSMRAIALRLGVLGVSH